MKDKHSIRLLCKCMGIHHSVYYYHKNNKTNIYKENNNELDIQIMEIYTESKRRYGSPKIQKVLVNKGIKVSQKRVARRMKELEIRSIVVKKYNYARNKKVDDTNKPNLLKQDFKAIEPKQKWVGDITYIYTKEIGWTYLAIVMDLYDLKTYGKHMTADLVIQALNNAVCNRGIKEKMIFHSDLGSQYTSNDYEELLKRLNIQHSYSKKGYPYDNASMESFNAILKKEEVNQKSYVTFEEARLAIFEFIESWYNNRRIHSSLGYITPNEKERLYYEKTA